MTKYLTEHKVRKLARKRTADSGVGQFASEYGINANQLSNYLSGYLPRCPPKLQEALGITRRMVYVELDHPNDGEF